MFIQFLNVRNKPTKSKKSQFLEYISHPNAYPYQKEQLESALRNKELTRNTGRVLTKLWAIFGANEAPNTQNSSLKVYLLKAIAIRYGYGLRWNRVQSQCHVYSHLRCPFSGLIILRIRTLRLYHNTDNNVTLSQI